MFYVRILFSVHKEKSVPVSVDIYIYICVPCMCTLHFQIGMLSIL